MPEEISWRIPLNKGYVILHQTVFVRLSKYRQIGSGDREAGGLLIGYRRGPHLEIVDATVPFPRDRRRRTFFNRCDPGHERYALRRWSESGRTMDYLGEWHTHPEAAPTPSFHDLSEWRILLAGRRSPLLFFILGTQDVWMGCGTQTGVRACGE